MASGPRPGDETVALDFKYDAWHRLAQVSVAGGSSTLVRYYYDGRNRLIHRARSENGGASWAAGEDCYHNAAWQVLERREAASPAGPTTVATAAKAQWVWSARYVDAPVLRDRDTDGDGDLDDERFYYTTDANFNVTAVVNDAGTLQRRLVYDPYGRGTLYTDDGNGTWSGSALGDNTWGDFFYCGYLFDPTFRFYHVRNRVSHPSLGRWVQRDPSEYSDGGDLYEYVGSVPVGRVDPYGEAVPVVIAGAAVGVSALEAAAAAFGISAAACLATPPCRETAVRLTREGIDAAVSKAKAAIEAIMAAADKCSRVRCSYKNEQDPHHYFWMPRWGNPPWKKCYMKHIELRCWIQGQGGSRFLTLHFGYGPCYKYYGGAGGVTH